MRYLSLILFLAILSPIKKIEVSMYVNEELMSCDVFVGDKKIVLNGTSTPMNRRFFIKKGEHSFLFKTESYTCQMDANITEGQYNPDVFVLVTDCEGERLIKTK